MQAGGPRIRAIKKKTFRVFLFPGLSSLSKVQYELSFGNAVTLPERVQTTAERAALFLVVQNTLQTQKSQSILSTAPYFIMLSPSRKAGGMRPLWETISFLFGKQ